MCDSITEPGAWWKYLLFPCNIFCPWRRSSLLRFWSLWCLPTHLINDSIIVDFFNIASRNSCTITAAPMISWLQQRCERTHLYLSFTRTIKFYGFRNSWTATQLNNPYRHSWPHNSTCRSTPPHIKCLFQEKVKKKSLFLLFGEVQGSKPWFADLPQSLIQQQASYSNPNQP